MAKIHVLRKISLKTLSYIYIESTVELKLTITIKMSILLLRIMV